MEHYSSHDGSHHSDVGVVSETRLTEKREVLRQPSPFAKGGGGAAEKERERVTA